MLIPVCHGEGVSDRGLPRRMVVGVPGLSRRGWWVFLVCKILADREQFRAFLFLVCKFLADQEHPGTYAGALISNCRVAGMLMWQASVCTS